ncbi:MAG: GldG family protein [Gammaproteobacteria bacterium]|nr:GldG family protein [Gammaproteobacteria bacterium]
MDVTQKTRLQYRIQYAIFILLFLTGIGLIAWLSLQHNIQSDWTMNKRNSLSDDTVKLLTELDGPVLVRSYQTEDLRLKQAASEILNRYKQHKADFDFQVLNPELDIELAKADNISLYGQTLIRLGDRQELVDSLNETNVSNALLRLSRKTESLLLFIQGHGERDPDSTSNTGYAQFKQSLITSGFKINTLNLLSETIPENTTALVLGSPSQALLETEVAKISQYIQQGGNLLWLQDPGELSTLQPIADQLGMVFNRGIVVDTNPNLKETLRIQHPAVVPILAYNPHRITNDIRYNTLFPIARALTPKADTEWQASPLLQTQPESWSETDGFALDVKFEADKGDTRGPLHIAYALEKQAEKRTQRIVIIGDSDFLANTSLGAGANLLLGMNIMNWLSEDDALISIAPKNAPDLRLELNDSQVAIIGFGFLVVLPLLLLLTGIFIWHKRRNR